MMRLARATKGVVTVPAPAVIPHKANKPNPALDCCRNALRVASERIDPGQFIRQSFIGAISA
jgi:hypothetical protein